MMEPSKIIMGISWVAAQEMIKARGLTVPPMADDKVRPSVCISTWAKGVNVEVVIDDDTAETEWCIDLTTGMIMHRGYGLGSEWATWGEVIE